MVIIVNINTENVCTVSKFHYILKRNREKREKREKREETPKKKKKKFHAAQFLFTVGQEREERGRGRQEMATVVGDASLDVCNLTEMKREESKVFYGWTCLGSSV